MAIKYTVPGIIARNSLVGGLTGSVGVFRNLKTGTTGRFVTVGAVIGIESGGTITGGHFESLASLAGAAQLNSLTIGFLNGSASFNLDGNFIGYDVGLSSPGVGASSGVTKTSISNCVLGGQ
ncbi:hypothetical protein [Allopontixanthobacter sp.]|uniref:hypothetical protein n=1 Tax=Allopontixanthobacter sp. TaxID=2906452 RepID=UPI002AB87BD1|nr:hypothetical protein [Allopontixanthobacter sp.]MDZ4306527.1 hypothetical protein [Allopontixanthobacter sp.]